MAAVALDADVIIGFLDAADTQLERASLATALAQWAELLSLDRRLTRVAREAAGGG